MDRPDVLVVGGGLMGAACAYELARRDVDVCLVERYAPGHPHGSSHGTARIVRRAYADQLYVGLTGRAFALWSAVESACGSRLIRATGGLDFGPGRDVARLAANLAAAGVAHEVLPAAEAAARWPGMRFAGDVLFHPQAGTLDADAAVTALLGLARDAGADVRLATAAASLRLSRDGVQVTLDGGDVVSARHVVLAAGAWLPSVAAGLVELPPLHVTRQQVFHFPRRDPAAAPWPSVIHEDGVAVYHLAGGGASDDRKLGEHRTRGPAVTPATRTYEVDAAARARAIEYVRRWLPGLVPEPRDESTCLYTTTPSEDFVVDRAGPLVVCSPCSGQGAKFAPLVGEYVAGLILGGADVPPRFRLAAHRTSRTRAGNVSL
jgi:sarcosine oxidase